MKRFAMYAALFALATPCFAGAAKGRGNRAGAAGKVTSIDAEKKTLTLTDRKGGSHVVTTSDRTEVFKPQALKLGDLKTGDLVQVGGAVSADGNSVEARGIMVLPADTRLPKKAPKRANAKGVRGTVSSTAPLKVKSFDKEVEVKATDATHVMGAKKAAFGDIKVGDTAQVRGQPSADGSVQAVRIIIGHAPAGKGARVGKKRNKGNK